MTEAIVDPAEFRKLDAEELYRGYTLHSDEKVSMDLRDDFLWRFAKTELRAGKRKTITGNPVAEIVVGAAISSRGTILEVEPRKYALVFDTSQDNPPFTIMLEPGEMYPIGREQKGQGDFPTQVSRDHCAIGVDEAGALMIENHDPTHYTSVRRLSAMGIHGMPPRPQL